MTTDLGSLVGDQAAHRKTSAQRAEERDADAVTSFEGELKVLVDRFMVEDVDEQLIDGLIDAVTPPSDPQDQDYDGDTLDALSEPRRDAIDALIEAVSQSAPLAVDGLVMAFAWQLLDMTDESEFLAILEGARAQVQADNKAHARVVAAWPDLSVTAR